MPSLREERLQKRVAEVRPELQKAREIAELADVREQGDDRRGAEDLRRDHGQGP